VSASIQRHRRLALFVLAAGMAAGALAGCRGQPSEDPPILLLRNMWDQQRYNPESTSNQFSDHRSMRMPVDGTVPRENYIEDDRVTTGRELDNSAYIATVPDDVVTHFGGAEALVQRGHVRYNIYCTPCHGYGGDGQGMVPVRALTSGYSFPAPPTFHQDRLRHAPDGQLYATVTNGVRNMPAYSGQIPVYDRWAIVSYVRALQVSQASSTGATP
jgi:mono/diheme cytochrome c family protein